jgi:alpha-L-rhamnosidase
LRQFLALFALALSTFALQAQSPIPLDPPQRDWTASWITHPTAPLREPIVLHFRRALTLPSAPASYRVRVSADNRFILFVNGHRVGDGPARGDLTHWRYELFDLAPLLKTGQNLITATVWNFGVLAPIAQMSDRTAFLLESEAVGRNSISTPDGWLVEEEKGHHATRPRLTVTIKDLHGRRSRRRDRRRPLRLELEFAKRARSSTWVPAASPMRDSIFSRRQQSPLRRHHRRQSLGPRAGLASAHGVCADACRRNPSASHMIGAEQPGLAKFPQEPATLPAGVHVHILLDRKTLTTAYPQLTVSGGKGAHIVLTYAEALYDKSKQKGDRDEIATAKLWALPTASFPTADRTAPLSRSGGAPGAISASISPPAMIR